MFYYYCFNQILRIWLFNNLSLWSKRHTLFFTSVWVTKSLCSTVCDHLYSTLVWYWLGFIQSILLLKNDSLFQRRDPSDNVFLCFKDINVSSLMHHKNEFAAARTGCNLMIKLLWSPAGLVTVWNILFPHVSHWDCTSNVAQTNSCIVNVLQWQKKETERGDR